MVESSEQQTPNQRAMNIYADPLMQPFRANWEVSTDSDGSFMLSEWDGDADDEGRPIKRSSSILEGEFTYDPDKREPEFGETVARLVNALPEMIPFLLVLQNAVESGSEQLSKPLQEWLSKVLGVARQGDAYYMHQAEAEARFDDRTTNGP